MAVKDITNQKFGKLTAISRDQSVKAAAAYWICQCECGNKKTVRGDRLRKGEVIDCGCGKTERTNRSLDTSSLIGKKFGKLIVLERDMTKPHGHGKDPYWICQCECGNKVSVRGGSLRQGKTKSCGCLFKDTVITFNHNKKIDMLNQKFGFLTVVKEAKDRSATGEVMWECECNCGNIRTIPGSWLRNGRVNSCGCLTISAGELQIMNLLEESKILYQKEYTFSDLKSEKGYYLRYDFAILDNNNNVNRLIEFDGEQHFKDKTGFWDTEATRRYDNIKNEYAKNHNIPLVRIPYTHLSTLTLQDLLNDNFLIL